MIAISFKVVQATKLVLIVIAMAVLRFTDISKVGVSIVMFALLIGLTLFGWRYAKDRKPVTKKRLLRYALLLLIGVAVAIWVLAYNNRL